MRFKLSRYLLTENVKLDDRGSRFFAGCFVSQPTRSNDIYLNMPFKALINRNEYCPEFLLRFPSSHTVSEILVLKRYTRFNLMINILYYMKQ